MNKRRTLGQIAYEAYCNHTDWKSLVSGADLPEWKRVLPKIRDAWEVAALAVYFPPQSGQSESQLNSTS